MGPLPCDPRVRYRILSLSPNSTLPTFTTIHRRSPSPSSKISCWVCPTVCPRDSLYSHYFAVLKKDGSLCPIINLRNLDKFMVYKKFQMMSILSLLEDLAWLVMLDLQDAYFHVSCQRIPLGGSSIYSQRLSLSVPGPPLWNCFGLKGIYQGHGSDCGTFVFPRVTNDWLLIADSKMTLLHHLKLTIHLLQSLGVCINYKKPNLVLFQRVQFIGVVQDTVVYRAFLPIDRAQTLWAHSWHKGSGHSSGSVAPMTIVSYGCNSGHSSLSRVAHEDFTTLLPKTIYTKITKWRGYLSRHRLWPLWFGGHRPTIYCKVHHFAIANEHSHDRCVSRGLGSSLRQHAYQGHTDTFSGLVSYQLLRTPGHPLGRAFVSKSPSGSRINRLIWQYTAI